MANKPRYSYIHGQKREYHPLNTESQYEAFLWLFNAAFFRPDRNWELWERDELGGDGVRIAYACRSEDDLSVTLTVVGYNS